MENSMDKETLRRHYLRNRKALDDEELLLKNKGILAQFHTMHFQEDAFVHIFLPIAKQKEPDTYTIHQHLRERYPDMKFVISRSIQNEPKMYHFIWDKQTVFETSPWGIPEPTGGQLVQPEELDVVLVPLLVFDLTGHRIGYGKGYYDQFLATCRPIVQTIGLSLFEPVRQIRPLSPGDIPLDKVVTPDRIYTFDPEASLSP
jgi:5-formyltetrahydrofolate cyclo-ligase